MTHESAADTRHLSTRRRVYLIITAPQCDLGQHDSAHSNEQQRCELQSLLLKESTTASPFPSQEEDCAQARASGAR